MHFHPLCCSRLFSRSCKTSQRVRDEIRELRRHLTQVQYSVKNDKICNYQIGVTPIAGLGKKGNQLNRTIMWLLGAAREKTVICTPYFNPPKDVSSAIEDALEREVSVTLEASADKVEMTSLFEKGKTFHRWAQYHTSMSRI